LFCGPKFQDKLLKTFSKALETNLATYHSAEARTARPATRSLTLYENIAIFISNCDTTGSTPSTIIGVDGT
jgi:hypothetical protein